MASSNRSNRSQSRRDRQSQQLDGLADWEKELLGLSAIAPKSRRAEAKAKTAKDANQVKQRAAVHKSYPLSSTSTGERRKSRRAIKRSLYGPDGEQQ